MSEPLLNVMKIMLLAGLYLFFVRVLLSVYAELRDPTTRAPRRPARATRPRTVEAPVPPASPHSSPRSESAPSSAPSSVLAGDYAAVPVGQLTALDPPEVAGMTWTLGSEITIGREPTCGLRIEDNYVSGIHARIFNRAGVFVIEDLDSRNGTLFNGVQLEATTELRAGDRIRFGTTLLEFS